MLEVPFLNTALLKWLKIEQCDDFADRLNYFVTASLLLFFAILISAKQYVGSPIQCLAPMEFTRGWEEYMEDYCFIQNTYYVPIQERAPNLHDERRKAEFGYYQWVPVVLVLQTLLFYLPNLLWKVLHKKSSLDLDNIISRATKFRFLHSEERKKRSGELCQHIFEALEMDELQRTPQKILCFRMGPHLGAYLTISYLFIKCCYLVNIFLQFIILNKFLETSQHFWGIHILVQLWHGSTWEETAIFPRVTLCDFQVRKLENIHNYTVQCVLMINMFNEKIYLFIWFWFAFVLISTFLNIISFIFVLLLPCSRQRTIRHFLNQKDLKLILDQNESTNIIRRFTNNALCSDGVLLLRFIQDHAGFMVARDVTKKLFQDYLRVIDLVNAPYKSAHGLHDITRNTSTSAEIGSSTEILSLKETTVVIENDSDKQNQ